MPALVARAGVVTGTEPLPGRAVPARACATEIHAYARALAKAPAEAALALRALMQRGESPVREASALP